SVREQATAEREFMKPWLESQRDIYEQALTAAAAAANARDAKDRATAEERFWQLYHGRMITVETREVSGGMVQVGRCLDGSDACDVDEMNARTRALATAMAGSMAATARMSYREFAENQFHYSGR
ncbi:MAG: hypothetical protein OEW19_08900, partial [Acidobacteriota bacterium]|nr:hypothetical protein [Acidobacteriota bacterium]